MVEKTRERGVRVEDVRVVAWEHEGNYAQRSELCL